jgi:hypothetical protein
MLRIVQRLNYFSYTATSVQIEYVKTLYQATFPQTHNKLGYLKSKGDQKSL